MKRLNLQVLIIELDHRRFEQAKEAGLAVVYGDAGQEIVLEAAGIKNASLLIMTIPGLVAARSVITHCKHLNEHLQIVARIPGPDYFSLWKELGVSQAVLPEFEASLEMTRQSLLRLQIPPTEVHRRTDTIREELYAHLLDKGDDYRVLSQLRVAEHQFDLQWFQLALESPLVHRSIGESEIRRKTGASVVGVVRDGELKPNPDADFVLMPRDLVAIIGSEKDRQAFCLMAAVAACNMH